VDPVSTRTSEIVLQFEVPGAQMVTLAVGQMNLSVGALGGMTAILFGGMMEVFGVPLWLAVPIAIRLLAIAGEKVRPARTHVAHHVLHDEGNRVGFGVERLSQLIVLDLVDGFFGH